MSLFLNRNYAIFFSIEHLKCLTWEMRPSALSLLIHWRIDIYVGFRTWSASLWFASCLRAPFSWSAEWAPCINNSLIICSRTLCLDLPFASALHFIGLYPSFFISAFRPDACVAYGALIVAVFKLVYSPKGYAPDARTARGWCEWSQWF